MLLNLSDQTRTCVFNMIWPQTFICAENSRNDDRLFCKCLQKSLWPKKSRDTLCLCGQTDKASVSQPKGTRFESPWGPNFFSAQNVQNDGNFFCRCLQKKSMAKKGQKMSKKACSTMYSQAVTHPSTNMAQCCLT